MRGWQRRALRGLRRLARYADDAAQWVLCFEPFASRRGFYSSGFGMARYPRRNWLVRLGAPEHDAKLSAGATIIVERARRSVQLRGERWAGRVPVQRLWLGAW